MSSEGFIIGIDYGTTVKGMISRRPPMYETSHSEWESHEVPYSFLSDKPTLLAAAVSEILDFTDVSLLLEKTFESTRAKLSRLMRVETILSHIRSQHQDVSPDNILVWHRHNTSSDTPSSYRLSDFSSFGPEGPAMTEDNGSRESAWKHKNDHVHCLKTFRCEPCNEQASPKDSDAWWSHWQRRVPQLTSSRAKHLTSEMYILASGTSAIMLNRLSTQHLTMEHTGPRDLIWLGGWLFLYFASTSAYYAQYAHHRQLRGAGVISLAVLVALIHGMLFDELDFVQTLLQLMPAYILGSLVVMRQFTKRATAAVWMHLPHTEQYHDREKRDAEKCEYRDSDAGTDNSVKTMAAQELV